MLPDGWKSAKIGEIAKFYSGGTPSKLNKIFWGGGHPWITAKDLKKHYLENSIDTLTDIGFANTKIAPLGATLILVRGMTLLKKFPVGYATRPMSFNQDIKALVPLQGTDGLFLSFFLVGQKDKIRQFVSTASHGTGKLDTEIIRILPINLPPLPEQQKIAQILSTWDKAIEKLEALITAKQKRKKTLMQQLLTGKKRFAGFDSEWKTYHLREIFEERNQTGFNDLNLLSITREKGVIPRGEVERKDTSNDDKSKYQRICVGDIGYNTMRMWQGVSALSNLEGIISPAYTVCKPKNIVDGKFISYLFKFPYVMNLFQRYSQGLTSDTWNLKFRHFSEIKVTIPEIKEQQKIAAILSTADKEIEIHQKHLVALKQQKQGLMQQLLTGKKRVKVA